MSELAVRTTRIQIRWTPAVADRLKLYEQISRTIQYAANQIVSRWLAYHDEAGTRRHVAAYVAALAAWHKADTVDRGPKPKYEGAKCITPELQKILYYEITRAYPEIHGRVLSLELQRRVKTLNEMKAAYGNLAGWMAVMLYRQGAPSFEHPLPIPIDKKHSRIERPDEPGKPYKLVVHGDRLEGTGKQCTSTEDVFELVTQTKRASKIMPILTRVIAGEYDYCGSNLYFDDRDGKWYLLLCYRRTKLAKQSAGTGGVAYLYAGTRHCWRFRSHGRTRSIHGWSGRHVEHVRRICLQQRWGRQDGYRYAGSANKGHGRNRAMTPFFRLSKRWKDFVKTDNHTMTRRVLEACLLDDVHTLVYCQPRDAFADTRLLARAGKVEGRHDSTGWDWHQVLAMLKYKAADYAGVEVLEAREYRAQLSQKKPVPKVGARKAERKPKAVKPSRKRGRKR